MFGTPQYIVSQTVIVILWLAANAWLLTRPYDQYPFVLLNLVFSTQAAYAAPPILLAQPIATRSSPSGSTGGTRSSRPRVSPLLGDKELTEQVARLTQEIHALLTERRG